MGPQARCLYALALSEPLLSSVLDATAGDAERSAEVAVRLACATGAQMRDWTRAWELVADAEARFGTPASWESQVATLRLMQAAATDWSRSISPQELAAAGKEHIDLLLLASATQDRRERWIYLRLPVTVSKGGETRQMTVELRTFWGKEDGDFATHQHAQWRYLEAFWHGDVFAYAGQFTGAQGEGADHQCRPRRFRAHRFTLVGSLRCLFQTQPHRLRFTRILRTEALPGGGKCRPLPGKARFVIHRRFGELGQLPVEPGGILQRPRPGIFVLVHTPMAIGFQVGSAAHLPARHPGEAG
jgi:hypothetical protein